MRCGGGATELTLPWRLDAPTLDDSPMQVLAQLTALFAGRDTSRKAAYVTQGWMPHLPAQIGRDALHPLLARNLAYQLARQGTDTAQADDYGHKLATLAVHPRLADTGPADVITHTLAVAEFLARESRSGNTREH